MLTAALGDCEKILLPHIAAERIAKATLQCPRIILQTLRSRLVVTYALIFLRAATVSEGEARQPYNRLLTRAARNSLSRSCLFCEPRR